MSLTHKATHAAFPSIKEPIKLAAVLPLCLHKAKVTDSQIYP